MRRTAAVIAAGLVVTGALMPGAARAAQKYTISDSSAPADVKVKIRHDRGQAINVSSVNVTPQPGPARLKVAWRLRDVTVPDRVEKLTFAWFDGPESAESRHGQIAVTLVDGDVTASAGCPLPAGAVTVKPKVDAVVIRVPYACFDTAGHQARLLTITPIMASIHTLGGKGIAHDNPLKSPGQPIQPGLPVSLDR